MIIIRLLLVDTSGHRQTWFNHCARTEREGILLITRRNEAQTTIFDIGKSTYKKRRIIAESETWTSASLWKRGHISNTRTRTRTRTHLCSSARNWWFSDRPAKSQFTISRFEMLLHNGKCKYTTNKPFHVALSRKLTKS